MEKKKKEYAKFIGFRAGPEVRNILDHLILRESRPGYIATLSDVMRSMVKNSPSYIEIEKELSSSEKVAA
jgi:hypothetical protein